MAPFPKSYLDQLKSTKIGLEIELTYNLSHSEWLDLYRIHCEERGECPVSRDYEVFKSVIMSKLGSNPLLYKKIHSDGGGIELSLKPLTEMEYWQQKESIKALLEECKKFKLYPSEKDGIHINIDIDIFTPKRLKSFLHVMGPTSNFKNFMGAFIGRPKSSDRLGNIDVLMGNFSGKNDLIVPLWANYVQSMLDNIAKEYCTLNLCFNKNKRPILEWRWFGSTTDINRLYALVEFTYSILSFEGTTLKEWVHQVRRQRFTRPHLLKEIRKYKETRKYLGIHCYI